MSDQEGTQCRFCRVLCPPSRSGGHFRLRGRKIDSRFTSCWRSGRVTLQKNMWVRRDYCDRLSEHTLPQSGIWLCVHSEIGWSGKALWDSEVASEQRPKGEGTALCTSETEAFQTKDCKYKDPDLGTSLTGSRNSQEATTTKVGMRMRERMGRDEVREVPEGQTM